jgi:nitronate monooxygenase
MQTKLTQLLTINFPLIMAPMFLVSNKEMVIAGMKNGIAATFPSLNYRNDGELESILDELNNAKQGLEKGTYGVNLIVQQTNPFFEKHLAICVAKKSSFLYHIIRKSEKSYRSSQKLWC